MLVKDRRLNIIKTDANYEETEAKLIFTPKMARMLSDTLYSNKIRAIIRELSTNARDAHVEAGHNKPFDVTIPSYENPVFIIRDYGTGMSPERVKEVWLNYGASTKEESNDYIGCLGLGSKTPLCYNTRTSTVESFYEGIHYIYSYQYGENGLPKILLISESKTSEPNGVKITVPVITGDISDWEEEAKDIYSFFSVPPKINLKITPQEYTIKNTIYGISKTDSSPKVIMGEVAYPLNSSIIKEAVNFNNIGLHIFVDIGEVDVDNSREGLSYDITTKNNIISKIKIVTKQYINDINNRLADLNVYQQRMFISKQREILKNIWQTIQHDIKYPALEVKTKDLVRKFFKYGRYSTVKSLQSTTNVIFNHNTVFIVNNLKKGGIKRVKSWLESHETITSVYIISKEQAYELCLEYGDYLTTDSLPHTPSNVVRHRNSLSEVVEFHYYGAIKSHNWQPVTKDVSKDSFYYVLTKSNYIIGPDNKYISHYSLKEMKDKLNVEIIGIRPSLVKRLSNNPNAKNYFEFFKFKYDNKIYDMSNITLTQIPLFIYYFTNIKSQEAKDISDYKDIYDDYVIKFNKFRAFKNLQIKLDFLEAPKYNTKNPLDLINAFYKKYPLLKYISNGISKQEVFNYIDLINGDKNVQS